MRRLSSNSPAKSKGGKETLDDRPLRVRPGKSASSVWVRDSDLDTFSDFSDVSMGSRTVLPDSACFGTSSVQRRIGGGRRDSYGKSVGHARWPMLSFSSPRLFGTDGVDGHCSMTGTCAHALQRENGLWEITPGAMAGLLLYTTLHFNSKNSKNSAIYNSAMYIYIYMYVCICICIYAILS